MVKRVDPEFKSAMPIGKPAPNVQLPMRIVKLPACKN
jgi:hypothetical protein